MAATVTPITSKATGKDKAAKATTGKAVGVKDLAEKLGTTPYNLRAFIRLEGLGGVGRGARYEWKSLNDPKVKAIIARWEAAQAS